MKKFMSLIVLVALTALPTAALSWNADGVWEARTMGSRIRADVKQQGDQISGVAKVFPLAGKKIIYHFSGQVQGDRIIASHFTGHTFTGKLVSPGRISGVLTTKGGHSLSVTASRQARRQE